MAITADLNGKNYALGRGKIFVDLYPAGTITAASVGDGERYLGNTPEASFTQTTENLDHFDADGGVRVKDDSVQLSSDRAGSFTCDNIVAANIALLLGGEAEIVAQASATGVENEFTIKKGRFYQLGASESNPTGVRDVSNVVVATGVAFGTTVTLAGNYEIDEVLGRIYIEADAADLDDDDLIQVTFNVAARSREQVVSSSNSVYCAMRFVSDNPKGANRDYYFPYVKLAPDGDYPLKGDEWQQMGFTFEILKKASNIEAIYVDGRPFTP